MNINDKTIQIIINLNIVLVFVVTLSAGLFISYTTYSHARSERICLDNGYTEYKNGYCVRDIYKKTAKAEDITEGRGGSDF